MPWLHSPVATTKTPISLASKVCTGIVKISSAKGEAQGKERWAQGQLPCECEF